MPFKVKFLYLEQREKDEFEYDNILDALQVAKNTEIEGRPAISDAVFNDQLLNLLTSGFIYAGKVTADYPSGNLIIMLIKALPDGSEGVAYEALPLAFISSAIDESGYLDVQKNK